MMFSDLKFCRSKNLNHPNAYTKSTTKTNSMIKISDVNNAEQIQKSLSDRNVSLKEVKLTLEFCAYTDNIIKYLLFFNDSARDGFNKPPEVIRQLIYKNIPVVIFEDFSYKPTETEEEDESVTSITKELEIENRGGPSGCVVGAANVLKYLPMKDQCRNCDREMDNFTDLNTFFSTRTMNNAW